MAVALTHWWQGPVLCGVCDHAWRAVIEIPACFDEPQVPMECPRCGAFAGRPLDEED